MSAAAHILAFLFAAPAGVLAYCAIGLADYPEIDIRHLCGAVLLFGFVLIGMPELTWAVLLYFVVGTILGAYLIGQERPTPPVQDWRRQAGPQPPRRAVHVDRELAWNKRAAIHGRGDIDWDRLLRMMEALDRDEMEQLNQFWNWQRRTRDTPTAPQPDQPDLPDPPQPVIDDIADDTEDEIRIWTDQ